MVTSTDARPILFQFENGSLNDQYKEKLSIRYLRSKASQSNKRMLVVDTGNLKYSGAVLQKQHSFIKYYIGIVDDHTKRIEKIEPCLQCTLKPKLSGEETKENSTSEKTYRQKTDSLVESFGSSKQKRLVSARKRNEEVNSTVSEKVSNVVQTIIEKSPSILTESTKSTDDQEELITPPINTFAANVEEMYHIDDIISYQMYQKLRPHAQQVIDHDAEMLRSWIAENKFSGFVVHHLRSLPSSTTEREKKAIYLCYMEYMIKFYSIKARDVNKKDCCPGIPNDIQTFLLDQFTMSSHGKRFLPKKCKDKILCYILVLALFIDKFELNCNLIIKDLKLGLGKVTKLLRSIGCSVRNSGNRKRKIGEESDGPVELKITATLFLPTKVPSTPVREKTEKKKTVKESPGTVPKKKIKTEVTEEM